MENVADAAATCPAAADDDDDEEDAARCCGNPTAPTFFSIVSFVFLFDRAVFAAVRIIIVVVIIVGNILVASLDASAHKNK